MWTVAATLLTATGVIVYSSVLKGVTAALRRNINRLHYTEAAGFSG